MTGPQVAVIAAASFCYGLLFHDPLRALLARLRQGRRGRPNPSTFDLVAESAAVPSFTSGRAQPPLVPNKARRSMRTNEMVGVFAEELGPDDPLLRVVATATAALEEASGRHLSDDELRTAARGEWPTTHNPNEGTT